MDPYGYPQYYPQTQQSGYLGYGRQTMQQNSPNTMELLRVQTVQQVEQVPVPPGQRRHIMVENEPVIAIRHADPVSGFTTTNYFRLEEFSPTAAQPGYITAEQLEARLSAFADTLTKPAAQSTRGKKGEQTE